MSSTDSYKLLDKFEELYDKARNAIYDHLDYVKAYASEDIQVYIETGEVAEIVDLIVDLDEVIELDDFMNENEDVAYLIRRKFNGEISEDQPHVSATENALEDLDIVKQARANDRSLTR
jgi:hypothetical protein